MTTINFKLVISLMLSLTEITKAAPIPEGEAEPCESSGELGGSSIDDLTGSLGTSSSRESGSDLSDSSDLISDVTGSTSSSLSSLVSSAGEILGNLGIDLEGSCSLDFILPCSGSASLTIGAFDLPSGCTSMDCFTSTTLSGFSAEAGCTSLACIPNIALPTGDLSGQLGGAIIGGIGDILGGYSGLDFILPCGGDSSSLTVSGFDLPSGCTSMDCFTFTTLSGFTAVPGCTSCGCIPNIALPTGELSGGLSGVLTGAISELGDMADSGSSYVGFSLTKETGGFGAGAATYTVTDIGAVTGTVTAPCTDGTTTPAGANTVYVTTSKLSTTVVTVSCTTCQ